jgi:hypothetical protein
VIDQTKSKVGCHCMRYLLLLQLIFNQFKSMDSFEGIMHHRLLKLCLTCSLT